MTILEAMRERHTVRKYTDRKIPEELVDILTGKIEELNKEYHLHLQLFTEEKKGFSGFFGLMSKGVKNYVALVAEEGTGQEEKMGYCGIQIALLAQTLGLNSWWVAMTYNRKKTEQNADIGTGEKLIGVIAVGYGAGQGVPHKSKFVADVSEYRGEMPAWFRNGVEYALLAPTAMNRQAFMIKGEGTKVSIVCTNGSYSDVDLGIIKYHFEEGAGRENFQWV